jgi:asparagine synthase (glutamine-hydrolysing)
MRPGERPERRALERMAAALVHRGPDDNGIEIVESVGLVHTRLAIVDPSPAGHQPMAHPDGDWWLTYNGEVFNHAELRRALPVGTYRGGSDTETLLRALAEWGEAAIARCNGLFAYAAVDLEGRRVLLVRDRFGVKPLYLARLDGALWFASEIGALLAAGVPRRPRRDLLQHAVMHSWANGPATPIEGVTRVLPGTFVSVDLDTLETVERRWYDPAEAVDRERAAALARLPRANACDELETALRTSVRRRLMSDVPVGTMCSGGLDSSLITAFAADASPGIHAFNASVIDQPELDEGPWAERVAKALGVELHTVRMTGSSWRADLVEVVRHIEYPLNHESSVPMAQIARLARADGVKVLLSGEGADELFGGYDWLHGREWADFARRRFPGWRMARAGYRLGRRLAPGVEPPAPDPPRLPGAPVVDEYEAAIVRRAAVAYHHHRSHRGRLEAALLGDLGCYLPHLLNRQDKSTMEASIETRVPFLDPELVALALNLPLEVRVEPERKGLLRDLGRRYLPPGVAERTKVGFGFDTQRYLVPAARPEFLDNGRLRELISEEAWEVATSQAKVWGHRALLLWTAEIWCRAFLEDESNEVIEEQLWRSGEPVAAASG